jgi:hypothetical protein
VRTDWVQDSNSSGQCFPIMSIGDSAFLPLDQTMTMSATRQLVGQRQWHQNRYCRRNILGTPFSSPGGNTLPIPPRRSRSQAAWLTLGISSTGNSCFVGEGCRKEMQHDMEKENSRYLYFEFNFPVSHKTAGFPPQLAKSNKNIVPDSPNLNASILFSAQCVPYLGFKRGGIDGLVRC